MFGFSARDRASRKAQGALGDFYKVRPPAPVTSIKELPLLAVDVETTGLKPQEHDLLSIGWVPIDHGEIQLGGAGHRVLRGSEVGDSAVIHRLTDDDIEQGIDAKEAVADLLRALEGRVMLVHWAAMETGFLSAACRKHFGADLIVPVVDTFAIERRHMERMGTYPRGEDLRLPRIRQRYGLPNYRSHNALIDALACAELYLALAASFRGNTLKSLQV
ncbi:exonuclease domain-containing protein [Corynebacterium freiburgense]|uniref:exonuclease domain-containing protein n=1 Tax=Corynebacterium freiburgense TaxID=556548 RepID=UPI00040F8785|nr:exonuclease domain-containing protein [Corynebacterium freiburgense]WJZ02455.1 DNA polymerase III PolC-type [Corynebacterium freiburgense]